jgi:hypothetical protein
MSTTITIPAPLVPHAREATIYELGQAGGDILGQSERKDPELREPLKRFDTIRAVLDALPADPVGATDVEPTLVPTMAEALRGHARYLAGAVKTARQEGHADVANEYEARLGELEAGLDELKANIEATSARGA